MNILQLTLLASIFGGCVTVQSITVSQIPAKEHRRQQVKAEAQGLVVLSIPFGTSFVEEATKSLEAQCHGKAVTGIISKFEQVSYPFVGIPKVKLEGYCS